MEQKNAKIESVQSLNKITKGSLWLFVGAFCVLGLGFLVRIILARVLEPTEFGVIYLGLNIVSILAIVVGFGAEPALSRQIAYNLGINSRKGIIETVTNYLILIVPLSIIISIVVIAYAAIIENRIFYDSNVAIVLQIVIIALPLLTLNQIIALAYLGDQNPVPSALFQSIIPSLTLFIIVVILAMLGRLNVVQAAVAYTASYFIATLGLLVYVRKYLKREYFIRPTGIISLLKYTMPIYIIVVIEQSITWLDTIMLGAMSSSYYVGIYHTALPLARLMPLIITVIYLMYIPKTTSLHTDNNLGTIKTNYVFLTKWITFIATPMFLVLALFPSTIITLVFGDQYIGASTTLQVLAFGLYVYTILGLSGYTLISLGYTKILLCTSIPALIIDLAILYWLIPILHPVGAAIATSLSKITLVIGWSITLYIREKLNPITMNLIKTTGLMLIVPIIIYVLKKSLHIILPQGFEVFVFIGLLAIYAFIIYWTKSITAEDKLYLEGVKNKIISVMK